MTTQSKATKSNHSQIPQESVEGVKFKVSSAHRKKVERSVAKISTAFKVVWKSPLYENPEGDFHIFVLAEEAI